jgi:hypothetical protein
MGDTYHVTMARTVTLAEAESAIQAEEATGTKSKGVQITIVDNEVINLLEFEELDEGHPAAIALLKASAAAPTGKAKVWEGTMVIENTIGQYRAYR